MEWKDRPSQRGLPYHLLATYAAVVADAVRARVDLAAFFLERELNLAVSGEAPCAGGCGEEEGGQMRYRSSTQIESIVSRAA
jgi:hypothetical protein